MPKSEQWIVDDSRWDELMELTGGAAAICYQCGSCTATCPWGLLSEETVSIRSLIRAAQLGLKAETKDLWLCTTCSQCEANCPRGVAIADVILGLRQMAWNDRQPPAGFPSLLWSIYWNNNPWTQPPSYRSSWSGDLNLPCFDASAHQILLYIGCTASYDRRAQMIARAVVSLLRAAGVSFGVLEDDEPCCGEAALSIGHKHYYQELAEQAATTFKENSVERLVTISPHCYHAFKHANPGLAGKVHVSHYTTLIARYIDEGRLVFQGQEPHCATFHDPCYLARHDGEVDSARRILRAIPGLELVEMPRSRHETLCCGAGGGRMWLETDSGMRFSDLRVREASGTGASLLATACPFCLICLEDSVKGNRLSGIRVMDVAEIAAAAATHMNS